MEGKKFLDEEKGDEGKKREKEVWREKRKKERKAEKEGRREKNIPMEETFALFKDWKKRER